MTDHAVACPSRGCPGVLRYVLEQRIGGFLAQCEPKESFDSPPAECGRIFRWNAAREEWGSILHDPRAP
jgi:hypothetical protein